MLPLAVAALLLLLLLLELLGHHDHDPHHSCGSLTRAVLAAEADAVPRRPSLPDLALWPNSCCHAKSRAKERRPAPDKLRAKDWRKLT